MHQLGQEGRAVEYLGAVTNTWPLAALAWAIATASALRQLRRGYKQRTLAQRAATVLLNSLLTSSLAVGCALLMPLAVPGMTLEMQVAAAVVLSGLGGETVKQWLLHKLGLSVVDLMNPDDINEIRQTMDPETRRRHAACCPFRHDECAPPSAAAPGCAAVRAPVRAASRAG